MRTDQIQELLQKCFSDGTAADWSALKIELEKEEHALLRDELFRLGKLRPEDLTTDGGKMWEEISQCRSKGRNRVSIFRRLLCYAAVIAVPIVIGSVLLWMHQSKYVAESEPLTVAILPPGQMRAILKLENGEQIDLETASRDTVFMRQGVAIHLDSLKSIFYQSADSENQRTTYNTIVVPRGGEFRLVLADGSVVWLNSGSELKFPVTFAGAQRKVFLKGEAYFDVAKNPALPFVVDVADMEVKVLGTRFNINAYREDGVFQTTLISGKVQVSNLQRTEAVILSPDQQAQAHNGQLSVRDVDASVYIAWMEGKFYFEAEPLLEIAAQLERWYDISFFFAREELKRYEFTGVIRRDYTANQILEIIEKTTNVKFDIKGRAITVR